MGTGDYYELRGELRGELHGANPDKVQRQTWIINYDVERALHNFHFLAARLADSGCACWPRVFASRDCPAIVVTDGELDGVREPHVMAWRSSFVELRRVDFLERVEQCLAGRRAYLGADIMEATAA